MKRVLSLFCIVFAWFIFAACGGGGSDSGGGGGDAPSSTPSPGPGGGSTPASLNGTYSGSYSVMASAPGVPSESDSGVFTLLVTDTAVIFEPGTSGATSAPRNGNNFSIAVTGSQIVDIADDLGVQLTCTGLIVLNGTINQNGTATGTLSSSNLVCSIPGFPAIPITLTGNFTATRTAGASVAGGAGVLQAIGGLVSRMPAP